MEPEIFTVSSHLLKLGLKRRGNQLSLDCCQRMGDAEQQLLPTSELFAVHLDEQRFSARNLSFLSGDLESATSGDSYFRARFGGPGFEVTFHLKLFAETALIEVWLEIRNTSERPRRITRVDSFSFDLPLANFALLSFNSDWGAEFQPEHRPLAGTVTLETRLGRSSKGMHPWFALQQGTQDVFSGSVAWSGNWAIRFSPLESGSYQVNGGLHDWNFAKDLKPSEIMEAPHCMLAWAENLNAISQQVARTARKYWIPRNPLPAQPAVEWNHWWSYEDIDINQQKFTDNIEAAAAIGVQACTLDAGWFGPSQAGSDWQDYRGDWDRVNRQRFPQGIRHLSDLAHARGMHFGLWCEIEGLGKKAQLNTTQPNFSALRAGQPLGYICLGNPQAVEWAYQVLSRLISEYRCNWIKLDFNLDPLAGCDRSDHGHGSGDGLFEHYRGYYHLLDRIRQAFPNVLLENCSSGGLRIDLGMLRHTHLTFLSDADWPVHSLQVFWGASSMLPADACLHWSFSEWRSQNPPAQQNFNPRSLTLQPHQLDYYTRIAMLGAFGMSQKLPDLPAWVAGRLADHIQIYRQHIRRFICQADLYRLTAQPRRDGSGERWCAFQYRLPDQSQHLLFVFRLPGAKPTRTICLFDLQPEHCYTIAGFEGEREERKTGLELMETGLVFSDLPEEGSSLLLLI